ncbi:MAG: hypothetical protein PHS54_00620 [Clostridia bacterium]|nr:hypothetical protein [Clostridia bacterium]
MDTLREKRELRGLSVTCFKQNGTNILCKINLMPNDALSLCDRTKSGLFKNKEFHDRFINMIVTSLDKLIKDEKINESK